ncbi:MAG: hypothetical protein WCK90_01740 [archaeon]
MDNDYYAQTNRILLDSLKKGISEEQKAIAELEKEELHLKKEIGSQRENAVKNEFQEKKAFFAGVLAKLNERASALGVNIRLKKGLIEKYGKSIDLLEKELQAKITGKENAEKELNQGLRILQEERNRELKHIQGHEKSLMNEIIGLKNEESRINSSVAERRKGIDREFDAEVKTREESLRNAEGRLQSFISSKNKEISEMHRAAEKEKQKISQLKAQEENVKLQAVQRIAGLARELKEKTAGEIKFLEVKKKQVDAEKEKEIVRINNSIQASEERLVRNALDKKKRVESEVVKEKERKGRVEQELNVQKDKLLREIYVQSRELEKKKLEIISNYEKLKKQRENEIEKESRVKLDALANEMALVRKRIESNYAVAESEVIKEKVDTSSILKMKNGIEKFKSESNEKLDEKRKEYDQESAKLAVLEEKRRKISEDLSARIHVEIKKLEGKKQLAIGEGISLFEKQVNSLRKGGAEKTKDINQKISQERAEKEKLHSEIKSDESSAERKIEFMKAELEVKKKQIEENHRKEKEARINEIRKDKGSELDALKQELFVLKAKILSQYGDMSQKESAHIEEKEKNAVQGVNQNLQEVKKKDAALLKANRKALAIEDAKLKGLEARKKKIVLEANGNVKKQVKLLEKKKIASVKAVVASMNGQMNGLINKKNRLRQHTANVLKGMERKILVLARAKNDKLKKEIESERAKHVKYVLAFARAKESLKKSIDARKNALHAAMKNNVSQLEKVRRERIAQVEKERTEKIGGIRKMIPAINAKIQEDYGKIRERKIKNESAIGAERQKFLAEKNKLVAEMVKIRARKEFTNENVEKLRKSAHAFSAVLGSIGERKKHVDLEKERLRAKITQREKNLVELQKVISEKQKRIEERQKLQKELKQIELVMNNALRPVIKIKWKVKTKTKVKTEVKWKTRQKIVVRTRNKIVNKIKWKIRNRIVKKPLENKAEMGKFLKEVDDLLGKLPKEDITKFSKSKGFKIYKSVMNRYGVK